MSAPYNVDAISSKRKDDIRRALINQTPIKLTLNEFEFALGDHYPSVRTAAAARDFGFKMTMMQVDRALTEKNPRPGVAVLLNHNHPVSQDQFDRIFKEHHHDILYVAAIQRPEWMPTTEQIELLSKKSADVIRALTERDDVAFTREQVLAGLSRVESKDCMVYALSFNFEMDTEIAEIGLLNPFADVRWAFARRKDYTPTKAQFKIMLQDEVAKVRYAALNRSDIVLDDELMACRKLDISEAEHDMWRQAIARQAAIVTDGCRKGVRRI